MRRALNTDTRVAAGQQCFTNVKKKCLDQRRADDDWICTVQSSSAERLGQHSTFAHRRMRLSQTKLLEFGGRQQSLTAWKKLAQRIICRTVCTTRGVFNSRNAAHRDALAIAVKLPYSECVQAVGKFPQLKLSSR
jgi:hypothetical protein